jgi:hypothetical protein
VLERELGECDDYKVQLVDPNSSSFGKSGMLTSNRTRGFNRREITALHEQSVDVLYAVAGRTPGTSLLEM